MTVNKISESIGGWNWGAFFLTPFWALSNQAWLGLICWLPHLILNLILAILMSNQKNLIGAVLGILDLSLKVNHPVWIVTNTRNSHK
ncbi:hypothetical protein TUMEXPCC7403_00230 [Tumidithrix helvetica PCC 7403]|uniref:hypothetical protein n=1 Tax=Tumidithrix helvetica TaxID=3457545 RepID=UPI003CADF05A